LIVRESVIRNFIISVDELSAFITIESFIGHKTNFTHFNVDCTLHLWQLNLLVRFSFVLKVSELVLHFFCTLMLFVYKVFYAEWGPRGKPLLLEVKFPKGRIEIFLYKRIEGLVPDELVLHNKQIVYTSRVNCSAFLP